ncbi:MAG TPA: hypothetical protein VKY37_09945, partial [Brumimicrobium sp.]|nr:hypothetical protein [Brumimicrobium sp.]
PPYYTACPNPWLNDFIEEWEKEKLTLEEQGIRNPDFEITKPYAADVSEGKRNPIYGGHSYHTKVPHPAIMRYLFHFTNPGDIVYDGFAGTCMTTVASNHCEQTDSKLAFKLESTQENINWGKRNSISSDLSPIATFIGSVYNKDIRIEEFQNEVLNLLEIINNQNESLYKTKHKDGLYGTINFVVWSEVFSCPDCGVESDFYSLAADEELSKIYTEFNCPNCSMLLNKRSMGKVFSSKFDSALNKPISQSKRVPVYIEYEYNKEKHYKTPDEEDLKIIDEIESLSINKFFPIDRMPFGSESRRNDKIGITHVHHFYLKRTLLILSEIYAKCNSPELKFLFTSCITGLSLQQRYRPNSGFPNMIMSGTLYIGSINREWNVFNWFKGKLKGLIRTFNYNDVPKSGVLSTHSATNCSIKDNSIDYIFTDPPFGANLYYSELNFIWESWLKIRTEAEKEAIENKKISKDIQIYNSLMLTSFKEYFRILKPGKWMTVEFSNTSAAVWNGIQTSLQNSGFVVAYVAALDKKQGSFKAVNTPTAVKQDLVISCYKPSSKFDERFKNNYSKDLGIWSFVEEHLSYLPIHLVEGNNTTAIIDRSPKILFDRLIAFYVQKGLPVPIDASGFQKGLRERFIERDGMFFTNEQVQEYDKKKKENPEFIQLSILVSSEQDGVLWLKNLLTDKSLTYQDIQPQWMQALAGVRKGDMIPELATILEENFLKDEAGKWYAPDPENEADLEKLRKSRLLRLFEGYKKEIEKPRIKLKEVRVEALREGFKQCYQDKDFRTIVNVGDRIPNNLLMEDEVLLQFYDIASSRV